jgi:hypothetical protein
MPGPCALACRAPPHALFSRRKLHRPKLIPALVYEFLVKVSTVFVSEGQSERGNSSLRARLRKTLAGRVTRYRLLEGLIGRHQKTGYML